MIRCNACPIRRTEFGLDEAIYRIRSGPFIRYATLSNYIRYHKPGNDINISAHSPLTLPSVSIHGYDLPRRKVQLFRKTRIRISVVPCSTPRLTGNASQLEGIQPIVRLSLYRRQHTNFDQLDRRSVLTKIPYHRRSARPERFGKEYYTENPNRNVLAIALTVRDKITGRLFRLMHLREWRDTYRYLLRLLMSSPWVRRFVGCSDNRNSLTTTKIYEGPQTVTSRTKNHPQ